MGGWVGAYYIPENLQKHFFRPIILPWYQQNIDQFIIHRCFITPIHLYT